MKKLPIFPDLKNKNVIITGGHGFLGKQHAEALMKNNANVIILDIVDNKKFKKHIKNQNTNYLFFKCDITNKKNLIKVKNTLIKKKLKIDILINNASINYPPNRYKIKDLKLETFNNNFWVKDISIGLTGALFTTQIFGKEMCKNKSGVIINVASDLGIIAPNQNIYKNKLNKQFFIKPVSYSVVKHGIIGLTKYTSTYWSKYNIRCNSISPGGMESTERRKSNNKIKSKISKLIPLGRMSKYGEYQASILYLASEASSYMTGNNLVVDGGRSIW